MKMNMSEISEIHNHSAVAELFIWSGYKLVYIQIRYPFTRLKDVCSFFSKHIYILPKGSFTSTGEYGGWIDYMIFTRQSDSIEHYICVDVIEDYIDDDKDVIMKLSFDTLYLQHICVDVIEDYIDDDKEVIMKLSFDTLYLQHI